MKSDLKVLGEQEHLVKISLRKYDHLAEKLLRQLCYARPIIWSENNLGSISSLSSCGESTRVPFHFCLFLLFLDHFDLAVFSLRVTIPHRAGMLQREGRASTRKRRNQRSVRARRAYPC